MLNKEKKYFKLGLVAIFGAVLLAYSPTTGYAQYVQVLDPYGNVSTYVDNYNNLVIDTNDASNITSFSAVLTGLVNKNTLYDTYNLSTWFEYGISTNLGHSTLHSNSNSGYANFIATISNLSPSTIYYFRAVAQSPRGVVYGIINSFRTNFDENNNPLASDTTTTVTTNYAPTYTNVYIPPLYPSITTNPATSISNQGAEMNALIVNSGNSASTWFEWGTSPNFGNKTETLLIGAYTSIKHVDTITGLTQGTIYYFRAVLQNSPNKIIKGATLSFTTHGVISQNVSGNNTSGTTVNNTSSTQPAGSILATNTVGSEPFLPISMLGWFTLIILILILLMLIKNLYNNYLLQKNLERTQEHI